MATPFVQINHVNQTQGAFPEIERQFLFIGVAGKVENNGKILAVSVDSDLDQLLGASDSDLKTQVYAAKVNAGQNWSASVAPIAAGDDWLDALDLAMEENAKVESVIVCPPVTTESEVEAAYTKTMEVLGTYQRFITVGLAVSGLEGAEDWSDYNARIKPIIENVAGNRVYVVPQLHGNNLGVLAGRLCNRAASIADTPMRVATGPLINLGEDPVDNAGVKLSKATLKDLEQARFSVPYWFEDYPGMYWADWNMLDVPAGDFQVGENLRILDYLARRVRPLMIARIADRKLNRTPASVEFNRTYLLRPLREASKAVKVAGVPFPAMIYAPKPEDLVINWKSRTEAEVYISAQPYDCPKKLTLNLMLDLASEVSA